MARIMKGKEDSSKKKYGWMDEWMDDHILFTITLTLLHNSVETLTPSYLPFDAM